MFKRIFILTLYVVYSVLLVAVLLVVLFPKDRFAVWIAAQVEDKLPGFACRMEAARYTYPFTIRLDRVRLVDDARQIDIPIERVTIDFSPQWPLEDFDVFAELYGGSAASHVAADSQSRVLRLRDVKVEALNLELVDFLQSSLDRQVKGLLSLSGGMTIDGRDQADIRFSGMVSIDGFRTKLRRPVLGSATFDFHRVQTGADIDRQRIELSQGTFSGDMLRGTFSGTVNLSRPLQQSGLDIQGGLTPQPQLLKRNPAVARAAARLYRQFQKDSIPYLVGGTVKFPEFRFATSANPVVNELNTL